MIKSFWTLVRGTVYAAEQEAVDRSALLVLDQHIRDASAGIEGPKRALAEAIAMMEADRDSIREARAVFAKEIARLRHDVTGATHRLRELERGRRIAHAAEAVRR